MLKKTIIFEDYNGEQRTEDHYFNLSKAELSEMELMTEGGFSKYIDKIIKAKNIPELTSTFKDIIMKSYGVKSDDGKRFIKKKELTEEFMQTEAYSELFMELITDSKAAADFMNGIIPKIEKSSIPAPAVVK